MNYGTLRATLAEWSKRSDLTSALPSIIEFAQERLNTDLRLSGMIVSGNLTTVAGNEAVARPADWLVGQSLDIEGATLEYRTPEELRGTYPAAYSGRPAVYSVEGASIILGPKPDSVYTIRARYYQKLQPFALDSSTDFVLTNHPSIYLAAGMVEIASYTVDETMAAFWEPRYQAAVRKVNETGGSAGTAGTGLRMRAR